MARQLLCFISVFAISQASSDNQDHLLPNPRIVEHPQNGYLAKDEPATLNCQAKGHPKPSITWYRNGVKVTTYPENPTSNRMIIQDGKLFFLRVIHTKREKPDVGVYYCNATNKYGSAISRNATLKIAVLRDEFRLSPEDVSVAIGDTATFKCRPPRGEPEPKVLWRKNKNLIIQDDRMQVLDNGDLVISQVKMSDADDYKCLATNLAGEKESKAARLNVLEKPSFRKAPADVITMEGKTIEFPCDVVGDKPLQVEWKKEAGNIKYGRVRVLPNHTLRIEKVESADGGIYVCSASNSVGTAEAVARLTVQYLPSFVVKPKDKVVGVGRTVTLRCSVTGIPLPTIIWSRPSQKPSGEKTLMFPNFMEGRYSVASDGTFRIQKVQLGDSGEYECEAFSGLGSAKASAVLQVRENDLRPPPIIKIGPQNQTLPTAEVGFLHCEASGKPKPSIWWTKNGNPIPSDSRILLLGSGTLQISDLKESDTGKYTCIASSETGETTQSATLLVETPNKNVKFHRTQDTSTFPGSPSKPTVVEVLDTSVKLSWQPNINHGDSQVFAYMVEYFSHEIPEGWLTASDSVQSTTYSVQNLKPETTYVFMVRARNSHGTGVPSPLSDSVKTRYLSKVTPKIQGLSRSEIRRRLQGIVVELTAVEPLPTSVEVRWKVHKEMDIIDHFVIQYTEILNLKKSIMGRTQKQRVSRTSLSYTIRNLRSSQWYSICIKAYNKDIGTQCSQPFKVQPLPKLAVPEVDPNPPLHRVSAPSSIVIHKVTETSISLKWLPPMDSQIGLIKSYEIFCISNDKKHNCSRSVNSNKTSLEINNLHPESTYTVKIAAQTKSGVGLWSKEFTLSPEQINLMKKPWFIGLLISIIGGTLWLALCIFIVWLCKKRKAMKKQKMQEMYSVPNYKKSDDCNNRNSYSYYRNGYSEKDMQNCIGGMTPMAPEFANLLENKEMEMQGPNVYNIPQLKTFNHKKDPVAPYATTTLINAGTNAGHSQDHMFKPISQHSGSGDSCRHEYSGDSNHSRSNTGVVVEPGDPMQSPTSDSGSHTTDENGFLLKKGKKTLKQITQPKQAMVNWVEFLPPPPEHPPPQSEMNLSQHSSGHSSSSQQYAEINCLSREFGNRSPMSPMSKISSCSCPVPHNATPISGCNMPAYSDTGCMRCCSPKYLEKTHYPPNQFNVMQMTQSSRGPDWVNCPHGHDTWGQRTIACTNPSRCTATEYKCRTCHSDQEQGGPLPKLKTYKIMPAYESEYQFINNGENSQMRPCLCGTSYSGQCNIHGQDGQCMDRACQSSPPCVANECIHSPLYHNRLGYSDTDHHMNIAVDDYHRNIDPLDTDGGPDYAGESTEEETDGEAPPIKEREDNGGHDGSNMSGVETWPSYTDQCNTEESSEHSSCHSDSDEAFLNEADFASAVAKAAEMSGLTVVGSTVTDPSTDKQVVKRQRRHHRLRPSSPYSTDSNFSEVIRKPYPKSQRKKQLMDQGKWQNRKDSQSSNQSSNQAQSQSRYSQSGDYFPSYHKPNFPDVAPQRHCRPKFQPPMHKSIDSKDEGQDSGISVEPPLKEGYQEQ